MLLFFQKRWHFDFKNTTAMKTISICILSFLSFLSLSAQDLQGAWERSQTDAQGVQRTHMAIVAGDFFSEAIYETSKGKFVGTLGGSLKAEGGNLILNFEFSSLDPNLVGTRASLPYSLQDGKLLLEGNQWTRVDDGTPGELHGAWLFSGRERDGQIERRDTSGPRKTMKILSGTRFQWIAYNTETGEFFGTGGGTYTTEGGKYTENIAFFSRDNSRVGASLQFDYALEDGEWHHKGKSSRGEPLYEIWTKRNVVETAMRDKE